MYEYGPEAIKLLKDENFPICIAAGKKSTETIPAALHDGGATRISGGFSLHQDPNLMSYFGNFTFKIK